MGDKDIDMQYNQGEDKSKEIITKNTLEEGLLKHTKMITEGGI